MNKPAVIKHGDKVVCMGHPALMRGGRTIYPGIPDSPVLTVKRVYLDSFGDPRILAYDYPADVPYDGPVSTFRKV